VYTGFIGVKMASLVNTVKNFICPWSAVNFFSGWATADFSRRTQFHGFRQDSGMYKTMNWIFGVHPVWLRKRR
jgi:hypothetical protein